MNTPHQSSAHIFARSPFKAATFVFSTAVIISATAAIIWAVIFLSPTAKDMYPHASRPTVSNYVGTFCAASVDTFIHAMIQREEGNSPSAALTQNAAMQTSGDFSLNTGEVKEIVNGAYFNSAPIPVGIVDSVAFRNDLFAACMVKNQHWSPLK